jgi:hypothetical protein
MTPSRNQNTKVSQDVRKWLRDFQELQLEIEKAKMAFVEEPTDFHHDFKQVSKDELEIKVDVGGLKLSYYPPGDQGLFDVVKPSLDTGVKMIMNISRVFKKHDLAGFNRKRPGCTPRRVRRPESGQA